jgi:hypothetical protein
MILVEVTISRRMDFHYNGNSARWAPFSANPFDKKSLQQQMFHPPKAFHTTQDRIGVFFGQLAPDAHFHPLSYNFLTS